MNVVPTAIVPPRRPREPIERMAVAALTDRIDRSRVTLISAPAGYGKTMAARQIADALSGRGRSVLWLAPRAGIDGVEGLGQALSAAAAAAGLTLPDATGPDALGLLIEALSDAGAERPVIVIDDAQFLPEAARAFVARIVAAARDAITTVIVSRTLSILPVARLRSLGYLCEIGVAELRLTVHEATAFLTMGGSRLIDAGMVAALVEETAGWAAGLAMVAGERLPDMASPGSTARRALDAFFAEEVMLPQPAPVRAFLADTSVLDEVTAATCAGVTGDDGAGRMLEQVEEEGLFITCIDEEAGRYAYHPLFRRMMLRRMADRDPARLGELHRRASLFFASAGRSADDLKSALDHAEASGDPTFLADQLERLAEPLIYAGFLHRISTLATAMPWSVLADRPMLMLALVWRRTRSLDFGSAETMIAEVEAYLRRSVAENRIDLWKARHLDRTIRHRRIMLDAARDRMDKVERPAEALLAELGDEQPYLSCTLLAQLMSARRELYHFRDMLRLEADTRRALGRPGSTFASIALKASIAPTLTAQGKVDAAETMLREAIAYAADFEDTVSGLAALPGLPLAELCYNRGDLDEARSLLDRHFAWGREWGFVDQLAAGHLVRARLLVAAGDLSGALRTLEDAQLIALECGLDRLRACAVGEQVRILLRVGDQAGAEAAFRAGGQVPTADPVPPVNPTRQHESIAIAWLRLEILNCRLVAARRVAKRWCAYVRHHGAIRSVIAFELLQAEIAILAGDRSEARRVVREAVTLAAPANWTQIFVDEGDAIGNLIVESYADGPALDTVTDRFASRLKAIFTGGVVLQDEEDFGLGGRLVKREREILQMVNGGLRNREIGDRLGLTEGTVKWYMQQIYDKLGVRRRPQAVMRARQLGILG